MVVLSSIPTSWGSDSHNRWTRLRGPGQCTASRCSPPESATVTWTPSTLSSAIAWLLCVFDTLFGQERSRARSEQPLRPERPTEHKREPTQGYGPAGCPAEHRRHGAAGEEEAEQQADGREDRDEAHDLPTGDAPLEARPGEARSEQRYDDRQRDTTERHQERGDRGRSQLV